MCVCVCLFILLLELLFGFEESEYNVVSSDESVNLTVSLLSGTLAEYSVTLQATVLNGSARG